MKTSRPLGHGMKALPAGFKVAQTRELSEGVPGFDKTYVPQIWEVDSSKVFVSLYAWPFLNAFAKYDLLSPKLFRLGVARFLDAKHSGYPSNMMFTIDNKQVKFNHYNSAVLAYPVFRFYTEDYYDTGLCLTSEDSENFFLVSGNLVYDKKDLAGFFEKFNSQQLPASFYALRLQEPIDPNGYHFTNEEIKRFAHKVENGQANLSTVISILHTGCYMSEAEDLLKLPSSWLRRII